jgi:uncharacterized protein (DUF58 family)
MTKHLQQAKEHLGRDVPELLRGGRYALINTRSLEFDDLRPYVPGDDVRDIDWKATARSGEVLIKRFVAEQHHKILLIADAGKSTAAQAPSGERKSDIATNIIGMIGLLTLRRADEIGLVFGDVRGSVDIRLRRGESHIESMMHRFYHHVSSRPARSAIVQQLRWAATHYRHPLLIFVIADEPDVDDELGEALRRLTARHDVIWAMVSDMPAIGSPDDEPDGIDIASGRIILAGRELGADVIAAYRAAESRRRETLSEFLTGLAVPHARIAGSSDIRAALTTMTGKFDRAR